MHIKFSSVQKLKTLSSDLPKFTDCLEFCLIQTEANIVTKINITAKPQTQSIKDPQLTESCWIFCHKLFSELLRVAIIPNLQLFDCDIPITTCVINGCLLLLSFFYLKHDQIGRAHV